MSSINTNLLSLNAQRNTFASQGALATSMQRLSSGMRVNSAKDDSAGLAIAERMQAQIRGMNVAIRNANDAISLSQAAEGALGKIGDMLQRMRELAVQSANATNGLADRTSLNTEYQDLSAEITRVIGATKFNQKAIIGADAGAQVYQVGANVGDTITITTNDMTGKWAAPGDLLDAANANTAIGVLDTAINDFNTERAIYGSAQNRFDVVVSTLQVGAEAQSAARSRIMDADYAQETANLSRAQVLQQAGNAMIAQANQSPQQVLVLLR